MKRFYALFFLCCVWAVNALAQLAPEFSTLDNPVFFRLQFTRGNVYLTDEGNGKTPKISSGFCPVDGQKIPVHRHKGQVRVALRLRTL